ncbi:hypothetical protein SAMD00019534_085460 [Acytostelium subglobosum LB1]|uniref:hypothetical protein n=1 Tax=Acytostelium subglobosum LB1 TaxID=1410327 RepID=UPI000645007B|nr:hypothetical protein SAMD00019534_085460 [Acytostelium subglobosum LB1]GAM25371.1 hypothetical protein SAMD00019534_085460 [Acytostelium subglobosum LB1]|eukprot:XP_012751891.1 hypothetical protein SAMD00019534_085460 [Acytostelium subglobosum LB1]
MIEVTFDQDLYRIDSISCPNFTCPAPAAIDCSCDYTNPLRCGHPVSDDPSCPPCPTLYNYTLVTHELRPPGMYPVVQLPYCGKDLTWTTIEANRTYTIYDLSQEVEFRYKAQPYCESVTIRIRMVGGETNDNAVLINHQLWAYQISNIGEIMRDICPGNQSLQQDYPSTSGIWTDGTYFIKFNASLGSGPYELTVLSAPIAPIIKSEAKCTTVDKYHRCLYDGQLILGHNYDYYSFNVTRPMTLTMSCKGMGTTSPRIYASDEIVYPYLMDHKWTDRFDSRLTIPIEPYPNGTAKILYYLIESTTHSYNYTCSITSSAPTWMRPLVSDGDQYIESDQNDLQNSADLRTSNGSILNGNGNFNGGFINIFPRTFGNPFWPVMGNLINSIGSLFPAGNIDMLGTFERDNAPKKRTFQAAVVLNYTLPEWHLVKLFDESELTSLQLVFRGGLLVFSDGTPLRGNVSLTLGSLPTECDYDKFQITYDTLAEFDQGVLQYSTLTKLTRARYMIDMFMFRDAWLVCQNQADQMFELTEADLVINTTSCNYTLPYQTDPCCNFTISFFQCCQQRLATVPSKGFQIDKARVQSKCSSPQCTESLISDYFANWLEVDSGKCAILKTTAMEYAVTEYNLMFLKTMAQCKAVYDNVRCSRDADCPDSPCNVVTRQCETPVLTQDKRYLDCLTKNVSLSVVDYIAHKYFGLNGTSPSLVDRMFELLAKQDCTTTTGLVYRNHIEYTSYLDFNLTGHCLPNKPVYDMAISDLHNICLEIFYSNYKEINYNDTCDEVQLCPWSGCNILDDDTCTSSCETKPEFCGYCPSSTSACVDFASLTNKSSCDSQPHVCLLTDGQYRLVASEQECQQLGRCTEPCGYQCTGYKGCVSTSIHNETECIAVLDHTWDNTLSLCLNTMTQQQCVGTADNQWEDCSLREFSECLSPLSASLCVAKPVECTSADQCERESGTCSDQFFFTPEVTQFYPPQYGKCVHGHTIIMPSPNKTIYYPISGCDPYEDLESQMGCFSAEEVISKEECLARPGSRWWTPANASTCETIKGCSMKREMTLFPNNILFNDMDEETCGGCPMYREEYKWTNRFTLRRGKWMPGMMVPATWMNTTDAMVHPTANRQTLILREVYNFFQDNYDEYTKVDDVKRGTVCRATRIRQTLEAITCSCSGPGGPQCFKSSSQTIGSTKVCELTESRYDFSFGWVVFFEGTVGYTCQTVVMSQINRQLYKAPPQESLTSSFFTYTKLDDYAILRDQKQMGVILSDGFELQLESLSQYHLCLRIENDYDPDRYPTLDFGEMSSDNNIEALNINTSVEVKNNAKYLCGMIPHKGLVRSYFAIARQGQRAFLDMTTNVILYFLAVMFGIDALFGLVQLYIILYKFSLKRLELSLVHLLILTVTVFAAVRSVYFFMVPTGKLYASPVADYSMVVLPTFIYFTSFSIIVILWFVFIRNMREGTSRSFSRNFILLMVGINFVLYCTFITIVLVFNYSSEAKLSDCAGRVPVNLALMSQKRVVLIIYASIQSFLSLVIGAAFVVLGRTIFLMLREFSKDRTHAEQIKYIQHQKKIYTITLLCSVGFILHCVFVLVLVFMSRPSIIFSFIGLVITEIIPSTCILINYNQIEVGDLRQSLAEFTKMIQESIANANNDATTSTGSSATATSSSSATTSSSSSNVSEVEMKNLIRTRND